MEENEKKITVSKDRIFAVVLAIMFIVASVQALQLLGMSSTLDSQQAKLSSLEAKAAQFSQADLSSAGSSSVSIPDSLTNLPDMVGGC